MWLGTRKVKRIYWCSPADFPGLAHNCGLVFKDQQQPVGPVSISPAQASARIQGTVGAYLEYDVSQLLQIEGAVSVEYTPREPLFNQLSIDQSTGVFSGTPGYSEQTTVEIDIVATGQSGDTASALVVLTVVID